MSDLSKTFLSFLLSMLMVSFARAQSSAVQEPYPRTKGYMSIVHPLVTINKNETVYNFSGSYTVGFPCGVNILKSDKLGFSFEIAPFIRVADTTSRVNNLLFHPGVMFRYPNGFTFISRAAFETSGRYGFTPVFNKVVAKSTLINYFVALSLPVRFGADRPASVALALQLGIAF